MNWHVSGTRYGIHMDTDGLLACGEPGAQLTWMDAKIGDWVVTPRTGKPVEVQALWYNALYVLADLAHRFGDSKFHLHLTNLAGQARRAFSSVFWSTDARCLFDVVDGSQRDEIGRAHV